MSYEARREHYRISTDDSLLDLDWIHRKLTGGYWATGIPRETVARSIQGSLCFGMYDNRESPPPQIAVARVITDRATFAYLSDVYVDEDHRGQGLSKWLVDTILEHPDLQGLRRFALVTTNAHDLYRKCGFEPVQNPERWMERLDPDIYQRNG